MFFQIWFRAWKLGKWYYSIEGAFDNGKDWGIDSRVRKEWHQKNDAASNAIFVMFDLPDADKNTFYVDKNEIEWLQGKNVG